MKIDDITTAILIIVRLGVVARFIFCMVKLTGADEDAGKYKKRAINAVIFWIIAECVWIIKDLVLYYYQ